MIRPSATIQEILADLDSRLETIEQYLSQGPVSDEDLAGYEAVCDQEGRS